jgi:hypothetical protein
MWHHIPEDSTFQYLHQLYGNKGPARALQGPQSEVYGPSHQNSVQEPVAPRALLQTLLSQLLAVSQTCVEASEFLPAD